MKKGKDQSFAYYQNPQIRKETAPLIEIRENPYLKTRNMQYLTKDRNPFPLLATEPHINDPIPFL